MLYILLSSTEVKATLMNRESLAGRDMDRQRIGVGFILLEEYFAQRCCETAQVVGIHVGTALVITAVIGLAYAGEHGVIVELITFRILNHQSQVLNVVVGLHIAGEHANIARLRASQLAGGLFI